MNKLKLRYIYLENKFLECVTKATPCVHTNNKKSLKIMYKLIKTHKALSNYKKRVTNE